MAGVLRSKWQAHKHSSEETFKKDHAAELLKVDMNGVTGYPVKFDKDLGPALDAYEKAKEKKNTADMKKAKDKAETAIKIYKERINTNRTTLGKAAADLTTGIAEVEKGLG